MICVSVSVQITIGLKLHLVYLCWLLLDNFFISIIYGPISDIS